MKKILSVLMSVAMIAASTIAFSGCNLLPEDYLPEYESGYYKYAVRTLKDGEKEAYIMGLTELGLQQTTLILPWEIGGIKIYGTGYRRYCGVAPTSPVYGDGFSSENLKRLYVDRKISYYGCEAGSATPNCSLVIWYDGSSWGDLLYCCKGGIIYGYNFYNNPNNSVWAISDSVKIGNVSYMYNYLRAPNDGWYWVDSYDNGVVEFIPPEPTRAGYTFGGWYKEPECINEWDFETDKTGDEITSIKNFNPQESISYLYAKWI